MNKNELKNFAYIWSGIFLLFGLYPIVSSHEIRVWSILIAISFVIIAIVNPIYLSAFYKVWIKLGDVIGGIISKIIMFILYFGLFTPISIILKILGKDLLNKKIDKDKSSYWIDREIQPQSMKHQF